MRDAPVSSNQEKRRGIVERMAIQLVLDDALGKDHTTIYVRRVLESRIEVGETAAVDLPRGRLITDNQEETQGRCAPGVTPYVEPATEGLFVTVVLVVPVAVHLGLEFNTDARLLSRVATNDVPGLCNAKVPCDDGLGITKVLRYMSRPTQALELPGNEIQEGFMVTCRLCASGSRRPELANSRQYLIV